MHPALVHAPIALLPLAVGVAVIGSINQNESPLSLGKDAMLLSAAGAVGSAVTGLIAGEEVNVEGASMDMLITHRNLNFVTTLVTGGMTVWRTSHEKPTVAYLSAGVLEVAVVAYSGYLGESLCMTRARKSCHGLSCATGVERGQGPRRRPPAAPARWSTLRAGGARERDGGADQKDGAEQQGRREEAA
jgi:uncharacterized membrane protein